MVATAERGFAGDSHRCHQNVNIDDFFPSGDQYCSRTADVLPEAHGDLAMSRNTVVMDTQQESASCLALVERKSFLFWNAAYYVERSARPFASYIVLHSTRMHGRVMENSTEMWMSSW